jgi:UDP-N-acetylglucosamine 2-epimerase (non-hydrolysing)
MKIKKILVVFGTRPEAIKMAPVIKRLVTSNNFETKICITAQHRQMLDQVLMLFDIKVDFDLNLMKKNQTLIELTSAALNSITEVILNYKPDLVVVHGDTTTTFSASLAAFSSAF